MGSFMALPNKVFPCSHFFSKTTPSHVNRLCHIFLVRGRGNWNVIKLSHVPLVHFRFYGNKKHPNLEKRVLTYQNLVCEEFLISTIL